MKNTKHLFSVLFLAFLFTSAVFAGSTLWILYGTDQAAHSMAEDTTHDLAESLQTAEIIRDLWRLRFEVAEYPGVPKEMRKEIRASHEARIKSLNEKVNAIAPLLDEPEEARLVGLFRKSFQEYAQSREPFFTLVDQDRLAEARAFRLSRTRPAAEESAKIADAIMHYQVKEIDEKGQEVVAQFHRKITVGLGIFFLGLVLELGRFLFVSSVLRRFLKNMEQQTQEISFKTAVLDAIVENIPAAIFLKDSCKDFRITLWNKAAERVFEIEKSEILGKTTHELFPPAMADEYHAADQRVINEGVSIDIPEEVTETKTKRTAYLHTRKVPIKVQRPEGASCTYLLGICEDITEQRKIQETLMHSMKMSSLGEMAGGVAHEINNPLGVIQGKASQLHRQLRAGTLDTARAAEQLEKIISTADRIARIVKSLRSLSRNGEKDPFQPEKLDKLVHGVLELCVERFKHKEVALEISPIPDLELECRGVQIGQVLLNLLNNSLDAVENLPEKWVRLEVRHEGDRLQIAVTDSGRGIPAAITAKIMQPFFTTKEVGKGTGLGLSISKGIVEDHGGRLWLDSAATNTRFVMEIPVRQLPAGKKAA